MTAVADPTVGHHLSFDWRRPEPDAAYERVAYCLGDGCTWWRPAPGSAYTPARRAHTEHLSALRARATSEGAA